jgi:protein TonB
VAVVEPVEEADPVEEIEPAVVSAPPTPASNRQAAEIREAYLAMLLAEIEKNKFYPRIARRRNLEGTIRVSFRLGCDGAVNQLAVQGEHGLLRKAAGKAVEAALPLPQVPAEIECPLQVDYAMAYTLERE